MTRRSILSWVSKDSCAPNKNKNKKENKNRSIDTNGVDMIEFDFETFYKKYPRKIGKKSGLKTFTKEIKTKEKFDAINKALDNYLSLIAKEKKEMRYVQHFSTFMNNWEDYIDITHHNSSVRNVEASV